MATASRKRSWMWRAQRRVVNRPKEDTRGTDRAGPGPARQFSPSKPDKPAGPGLNFETSPAGQGQAGLAKKASPAGRACRA